MRVTDSVRVLRWVGGGLGFTGSACLALVGNAGAPRPVGVYWRWVPPLSGARIGDTGALEWARFGLVLLIGSWLVAGLLVKGKALNTRQAVLLFAVTALPLLLSPPLFSDDVYDYVASGALQLAHFDPYLVGPHSLPAATRIVGAVSPAWTRTPTPYGPGMLLLSRTAARVAGRHDIIAVTVLRLVTVGCLLACVPSVTALSRRVGSDPAGALWLTLLNPLTVTAFVAGGHNDAVMMAPLLAAFWAYRTGHRWAAQLGVVCAAEIKVVAVVGIGALALCTARRARSLLPRGRALAAGGAEAAAGISAFLALTTLLGLPLHRGLLSGWGWVHDLGVPGRVLTAATPLDAAYRLAGGPADTVAHGRFLPAYRQPDLAHLRSAALVLFVVIALVLLATAADRAVERTTGLILLTFLACGAVLWPWYLLWPTAFLAIAGNRRERLSVAALSVLLLFIDSPGGPTLYGDPRHFPGRTPADILTVTIIAVGVAILLPGGRDRTWTTRHLHRPSAMVAR